MRIAMSGLALGVSRRMRLAALTLALVVFVKLGGAMAEPAPPETGARIALPLPPAQEQVQ
ncbi:hypothetical protein FKB34_03785 [Glycocaulis profundi]|nr:hypothetical protein FKB34_03785 [Glycocaulis profundi]